MELELDIKYWNEQNWTENEPESNKNDHFYASKKKLLVQEQIIKEPIIKMEMNQLNR